MNTDYCTKYLEKQKELYDLVVIQKKNKEFFEENRVLYKSAFMNGKMYTKLKYQANCRFNFSWKQACRGTIYISDKINNDIDSYYCLNKFFNVHEIPEHLGLDFDSLLKELQNDGYEFLFMTKYDGSCVQCFTDKNGHRYRFTLGCLDKNTVGISKYNYHDLVEKLLKKQYPKLYDFLDVNPQYSFIGEIMTPHNIIKTEYDFIDEEGFLKPIVLINEFGIPTWRNLDDLTGEFERGFSTTPKDAWSFKAEEWNAKKDEIFEELLKNPQKYGVNPEGLVAYCYKDDICFPIAKLKRLEYFNFITKNDPSVLCQLQKLKIQNTIDDQPLVSIQDLHIKKFSSYLDEVAEILKNYDLFAETKHIKEFSNKVNSLPKHLQKKYAKSLYALKKENYKYTNSYDFIIDILNIPDKTGVTCLESLQKRDGYMWFEN